jgi:hypothetical protein
MVITEIIVIFLILIVLLVGGWLYVLSRNTESMRRQLQQITRQHTLINANDKAREVCIAVHKLRPDLHVGVDFTIASDGHKGKAYIAEWNTDEPRPTEAELKQAMSIIEHDDYAAKRLQEYPSVGDQLDAAYKARQGNSVEQNHLDAIIEDVKNRHPKPGECA